MAKQASSALLSSARSVRQLNGKGLLDPCHVPEAARAGRILNLAGTATCLNFLGNHFRSGGAA
jgi:hypothetical protein